MADTIVIPTIKRRDDPFFNQYDISMRRTKPVVNQSLEYTAETKLIQPFSLIKIMDAETEATKGSVDLQKQESNLPFLQQSIYNQVQAEYELSTQGPVQSLK